MLCSLCTTVCIVLFQFDMQKLRNELVSLYTVDSIRRMATECIVPLIVQTFSWDGAIFKANAERRLMFLTSKVVRETLPRRSLAQSCVAFVWFGLVAVVSRSVIVFRFSPSVFFFLLQVHVFFWSTERCFVSFFYFIRACLGPSPL